MSQLSNVQAIAFSSAFTSDKVICVGETTYTKTNNTVGAFYAFEVPISNDSVFAHMIYSYDGGLSWNDVQRSTKSSVAPQQNTILVYGAFDLDYTAGKGIMNLSIDQSAVYGGGATNDIIIKYALLAKEDQPPIPSGLNNGNVFYNSKYSYLKIAQQGSFSHGAGTNSTVITHSLGYPPTIDIFLYSTTGNRRMERLTRTYMGNELNVPNLGAFIDDNTITIYTNAAYTVYYKIYYEN